jgi:hypothetical protein
MKSRKVLSSIEDICDRRGAEWLLRVIEIHDPPTGELFIDRLYQEISKIVSKIEESAQYRQNDSEDRITIDIVIMLRQTGYDATHDTDSRGHVDIRVNNNNFVWLGEAKIHSDYNWLLSGLKQLHTRYLTGREDGSGLLIYINVANAKNVMDEWRKRLELGNECNLKETSDCNEKLTFWSIHLHEASGLDIKTKHIGVSLYYRPEK